MGLFTPRTTERIYFNGIDISEIVVGYNEVSQGVLIFIFLPEGRRLKTTQGTDYRTWVYGRLRIERPICQLKGKL